MSGGVQVSRPRARALSGDRRIRDGGRLEDGDRMGRPGGAGIGRLRRDRAMTKRSSDRVRSVVDSAARSRRLRRSAQDAWRRGYVNTETGITLAEAIARALAHEPVASRGTNRRRTSPRGSGFRPGCVPIPSVSFMQQTEPGGTDNQRRSSCNGRWTCFARAGGRGCRAGAAGHRAARRRPRAAARRRRSDEVRRGGRGRPRSVGQRRPGRGDGTPARSVARARRRRARHRRSNATWSKWSCGGSRPNGSCRPARWTERDCIELKRLARASSRTRRSSCATRSNSRGSRRGPTAR